MVQASQPDSDSSTPIPWHVREDPRGWWRLRGAKGPSLAEFDKEEDAILAVRAVNNHAKLLAMLKRVLATTLEIDKSLGQGHFNPGTLQKMADVIGEAQS